jgi:hypothetical protein
VDWRVDPEGTDGAREGAWALGEPEEASAAGILTQPGADHTPGDGKLAFVTGPARGDFFAANDLDEGRTTLESPIFDLEAAADPTLVFWAWRSVWDFASDPVRPLDSAPLVVEVSADGGATWRELGRFAQQTEAWTRVSYRIRDALEPTSRTRFRFSVEETQAANTEVAIDDLEIVDFLATCEGADPEPDPDPDPSPGPEEEGDGDEGGGCRCARATPPDPELAAAILLGGLGLARRRRAW